jgi:hypothetical protein
MVPPPSGTFAPFAAPLFFLVPGLRDGIGTIDFASRGVYHDDYQAA